METTCTVHAHSLFHRMQYAVLLGVLACAVLGAAPRADAACLPAPAWASGPSGTITDPRPTFSWGAVGGANFGYTLYILPVADGPTALRQTGIMQTSLRPGSDLPIGVDLRWKVKGEGSCGTGDYASGGTFRIVAPLPCPPTVAPTLFGPSGTITGNAPTFSWTPVNGADEYVIALLFAADDGDYVFGEPESTTGTSFNFGPLPVGVPMRWKVKTECNELYGPFSPSVYFQIAP